MNLKPNVKGDCSLSLTKTTKQTIQYTMQPLGITVYHRQTVKTGKVLPLR